MMITTVERRYSLDEYRTIEEKLKGAVNIVMEKLYQYFSFNSRL